MSTLAAVMNLVIAQAIRSGDPRFHWMSESWEHAYVFELGLAIAGKTYAEFHREWEAA